MKSILVLYLSIWQNDKLPYITYDVETKKLWSFSIGRLSFSVETPRSWGYFDNKLFDVKGVSLGWLVIGWWYDDVPEGLK